MDAAKRIMLYETTPEFKLYGKTGGGRMSSLMFRIKMPVLRIEKYATMQFTKDSAFPEL